MIQAVYPGTFDPMTRGHEDLVRRASSLFDEVIVAVADSRGKQPFFSYPRRLGHELCVEVVEAAHGFAAGDRHAQKAGDDEGQDDREQIWIGHQTLDIADTQPGEGLHDAAALGPRFFARGH